MNTIQDKLEAFKKILEIMDDIREKCPWDKEQTNETLRAMTIEETYELVDAVLENDVNGIKKELGDLFLHIIFYSKIASEKKQFDIADVINSLSDKLIYRHPHVFGNEVADNPEDVKKNWEELKLKEKGSGGKVLSGIPSSLPSMIKAVRMQEKARGVGFDWDEKEQVWGKVKEELSEFEEEIKNGDKEKMEDEFGDLMFSLINAARLYDINPDNALERTNRKFIKRFNFLEKNTINKGLSLKDMSLEEMEIVWQKAKNNE
ncbi:MAG: nucleoside triphosphate pyrophosphohydrolase [Bacteroidales bacterium]|nr:nucleoside triphosphate pyrophosphohydrolase [Bacteroidales bacterium]